MILTNDITWEDHYNISTWTYKTLGLLEDHSISQFKFNASKWCVQNFGPSHGHDICQTFYVILQWGSLLRLGVILTNDITWEDHYNNISFG